MINSTALALRSDLAMRFGGEVQLNIIARRFANIFKVDWEEATRWPDVFGSILQAAQLSWEYGAMPSRHLWMIPFNKEETINEKGKEIKIWRKTYSCADSYEWRKFSADDKAKEMKLRYVMDTKEIPTEEMPKLLAKLGLTDNAKLGGAYHPEDIGYRSRVIFLDHLRECKELGLEYNPPYHYGFWRKFAQLRSNKWEMDNVPVGRTRDWVSVKRSEKSALQEHFELRPLAGWHRHDDRVKLKLINEDVEPAPDRKPQESAMFANRPSGADEEALYAA